MANPEEPRTPDSAPLSGCLLQLLWSIVCPGLVLIAGGLLLLERPPVGSAQDLFLLGAVLAAVAARHFDPTKPGTAAPGEAPPPGRGRYAAWVAGAGASFFVVGHFVAPLFS